MAHFTYACIVTLQHMAAVSSCTTVAFHVIIIRSVNFIVAIGVDVIAAMAEHTMKVGHQGNFSGILEVWRTKGKELGFEIAEVFFITGIYSTTDL